MTQTYDARFGPDPDGPAQDWTSPEFTGATSTAAGVAGSVPAPTAGQQAHVLVGDGTWTALESVSRGIHTLYFPAGSFELAITNGPVSTALEIANGTVIRTLAFDATTIETAFVGVRMPKSWNVGTVTASVVWSHTTGTGYKVSWGISGLAVSNDDALNGTYGTEVYSNDTGGTSGDVYTSPTTTAITIAGTPASEDVVFFKIRRKADDGTNDTLTDDAYFHGLTVYYTVNVGTDA